MRHSTSSALVLACALGAAACGDGRSTAVARETRPAPRVEAAAASGAALQDELAARPARWQSLRPSPDGQLTSAHVEMYLAVRRRALRAALEDQRAEPAAIRPPTLASAVAAEAIACRRLGCPLDTYEWVRARIAEASQPAGEQSIDLLETIDAAARRGRQRLTEAAKPGGSLSPSGLPSGDVRSHNATLLERFRAELDALADRERAGGNDPGM